MADTAIHKIRPPLTEATNRVNSPCSPIDQNGRYKPYNERYRTEVPTRAPSGSHTSSSRQPDIRVTAAPLASNPPMVVPSQPTQEQIDQRRLSQASYDSSSSNRSKKNYKTHVGPWQLGRTLGKGSSARVRLCRHAATNQLAAVKIVNRRMAYLVQDSSLAALTKWDSSLPPQINGEMRVPMAIEREVAILKLIEHPHIMKLYDIWENRSEIYLILEYIDHGDLFTYINSRGRLPEEVALYFFRQMISAITYCHSFNICHRDLKPENILISKDLQIKIADFGMAALHQTDTHHLATACGSPHYAAPELLKNRQYRGDKADIWSMGVILYAMLAATLPFDDPDLRVMMNKTKKGQYVMPKHISLEAEDLIKRMLQVNPDRRISLKDIWRHPLVQKYSYLDNYGENNGQPPDIRKGFQYSPVPPEEIDFQLLRQLRSMWHMFSEEDLAMKLSCKEPNDQKAFYWLLYRYREKQLEDFRPELAHSTSDYHHLKPAIWKKRVATCQFAQPRANGHGRSVSKFTVISNAAETESETVQSYDPYRGSRMLKPCTSQISQAKITVHRDRPASSGNHTPHSTKMRSNSTTHRVRSNSSRAFANGRPASSRGSMASLHSARHVGPGAPGASLRHKRGVDFTQVRKQSNQAQPPAQPKAQVEVIPKIKEPVASQPKVERSLSPELPVPANGIPPMAKGAPSADLLFNDELRHFSSNIAKDCDEAFGSSLIEDESMAGSLTDGDRKQRESPLSFNLASSPDVNQGTGASAKPWDLRPLPPLPPNNIAQGDGTDDAVSPTSGGGVHLDSPDEQSARFVPVLPTHSVERRVVSAPAQTNITRKPVTMPSINENKALNSTSVDKARIVSAPPHNSRGRHTDLPDDMEFLSKVENSIRVVNSSSESPVKIPKPLNVRKKSTTEVLVPHAEEEAIQTQESMSQDAQNGVKKRKLWFRRTSRAESDSGATVSSESHDQKTLVGSEPGNEGDTNTNHIANKKKSFTFPFWKSNKMAGSTMSIDEELSASAKEERFSNVITIQPGKDKRDSAASSQRNIEVKQNWLARLFRVKPATRYLCLTISRRRARQEVAILLREWRKYGIRGIQVDKQRNIVFARVGTKNYLDLKEVEFAAEVMTVIEHGKKQQLSIIRFTQERGAASSFHKVVETMKNVFESRNLLVADERKQKMMIKTLNS
ncbi:unnamed protein product [Clonostachys rosea]|uniref:non-specific serine/threonine protein kinase n=1 Tax=Bionectria ochroleuca TaxID=29856 RepID=A0ABY6UM16_BIOOC|nr:unnamed protein product [Clonostachys rosea]